MLASALRWNVGDGSFQDFQQGLLHALTAYIAGDRGVFILAANLVNLVNINNAGLGPPYVAIRCLQQLEHDVFDIFAYITGFSERGGVHNGKRNVQHSGQGLGQ